jgi:hypothetical protein
MRFRYKFWSRKDVVKSHGLVNVYWATECASPTLLFVPVEGRFAGLILSPLPFLWASAGIPCCKQLPMTKSATPPLDLAPL